MRQTRKYFWLWLIIALIGSAATVKAVAPDDESEDYQNNRVARITQIRGDIQIRRADSQDWEEAVPNLPLVEGDRIAAGADSRVEIQLDRDDYVWLAENSLLKIVTLNDGGTALSLPEGSVSVRLKNFNKSNEFFEIDAPQTTVAVEKSGLYRVDAPQGADSSELRVTVTGGGQARVYSQTSGYTIRNNRVARVFLVGEYAGDVDSTGAAPSNDYFDQWIAEREDSNFRRRSEVTRGYYDDDVYGADDLNEYGEWIESAEYGRVWRPYRASTDVYDNWTPYRYGSWRYISNYGWTWIADEPWGWATSHYGRWVWVDNGWSWCPRERSNNFRRAFWRPALVVFGSYGNDIYWYPLPYNCDYRYNRRSRTVVYNTTIINNTTVINNPARTTRQRPSQTYLNAYALAVTKFPAGGFGKMRVKPIPVSGLDGKRAVDALANGKGEIKFGLPERKTDFDGKIAKNRLVVEKRDTLQKSERGLDGNNTKIGAMQRDKGVALDGKLRNERIFNGRNPSGRAPGNSMPDNPAKQPHTGVFERQPTVTREKRESNSNDKNTVFDRPTTRREKSSDAPNSDDRPPVRAERENRKRNDDNQKTERPRKEERDRREERNRDDGGYQPPPQQAEPPRQKEPERRSEPRVEQPQKRDEPKYEPPPRREEPRFEPPPQKREEPRPEPPPQKRDEPKQESPPSKSESKPGKDGQ